jgi:hypothetical protein
VNPFFFTDDDRHSPLLSRIWITSVREVKLGSDPSDKDERKSLATARVVVISIPDSHVKSFAFFRLDARVWLKTVLPFRLRTTRRYFPLEF